MYFFGIGSSVTSNAYNNVLPDVTRTHILNPPVLCDITYLHIFEIFNLFIPFSIGVDSSFVFRGTPCRLVWFVCVGIGGHLGSSRQQRLGFIHMAPRRMRVMPSSVFFNFFLKKPLLQRVHLQMCGEVLRCLGSNTSIHIWTFPRSYAQWHLL